VILIWKETDLARIKHRINRNCITTAFENPRPLETLSFLHYPSFKFLNMRLSPSPGETALLSAH